MDFGIIIRLCLYNMRSVTIIFTCYNRCEMTVNCIKTLQKGNQKINLLFVVVDDNSNDGTKESIDQLMCDGYDIMYQKGTGSLYWAGGMRKGIDYALKYTNSDYYLFVNDDVDFESSIIENMIEEYENNYKDCKALVGATYDSNSNLSYGGIKYTKKGIKYEKKGPDYRGLCDTFCMNCVLVNNSTFFDAGNFDKKFVHSLADFDYGLRISRKIGNVYMFSNYVGMCNDNPVKNTWADTSLSRVERIKKKETPKGAPFGPWFRFLYKNFGFPKAIVFSLSPYIRILLGK